MDVVPNDKMEKTGGAPPDRAFVRFATERQIEILDCAVRLFDERGYHQSSVGGIADAAGIRKSTLYHHFKSKDELLFWIHEEFVNLLLERYEARQHLPLTNAQRLLGLMGDILELMDTHRGHVRVFFEHHRELGAEHRAWIGLKRDRFREHVERVIRDGIASGEFRPVDPRLTTLALFGTCNWAYQWYRNTGPLTSRDIALVFHDLILNGLAATQSTDTGGSLGVSEVAAV